MRHNRNDGAEGAGAYQVEHSEVLAFDTAYGLGDLRLIPPRPMGHGVERPRQKVGSSGRSRTRGRSMRKTSPSRTRSQCEQHCSLPERLVYAARASDPIKVSSTRSFGLYHVISCSCPMYRAQTRQLSSRSTDPLTRDLLSRPRLNK